MSSRPPTRGPGVPGRVRAGDADRARATSLLSEHYAQGRLDDTELDHRTSRALEAVYTDELDGLFVDLPGVSVGGAPVVRTDGARSATSPTPLPRRSWVPALLVVAIMLVVLTRGAALWLLFPLWWFASPALLGRRRVGWDRRRAVHGAMRRPVGTSSDPALATGAGSSCRRWSA